MIILSTETYDEAMNYLITEYGLYSDPVNTFFKFGKTDEAVHYACSNGFNIDE